MRKRERHGLRRTKEYSAWCHIKRRCNNVNCFNYEQYGGRGITVCGSWNESFLAFFNDMGVAPNSSMSVDRIDNDKGYYKENCRWATRQEQAFNRRTAHIVTYNGETKNLKQWCYDLNIDYRMVWLRLKRGWSIEDAITTTPRVLLINIKRWGKSA